MSLMGGDLLRGFGPSGSPSVVLDPDAAILDSPASIIAAYLKAQSLVVASNVDQDWKIFVSSMPAEGRDNAVAAYDTTPVPDGRIKDGTRIEHPGIQIRIRSKDYATGWVKSKQIIHALDTLHRAVVTMSTTDYLVQNVSIASGPIYMGLEETKRRATFSINALATITAIAP